MPGPISDTNEEGDNGQGLSSLVGAGNLTPVDTITEDGITKLEVKSSIIPQALGNVFFLNATNITHGGELNRDGSVTPIVYTLNAESGVGARDLVVSEIRFSSRDNGIKVENFLGLNAPLTTGIVVDVINSSGETFSFLPIVATNEFESHFAYGPGARFTSLASNSSTYIGALFSPRNPFVLVKDTADKISVTISDDLSTVQAIEFIAFGFKD